MATADSVKAKLQALIAQANAKTGRADTDLTSAVDELITGYGQGSSGECTLPHIIEVTELPTENIDESAPYKMGDSYYRYIRKWFVDLIYNDGSGAKALSEIAKEEGTAYSLNTIPTKTTENIYASVVPTIYHFYYIEDENDIFIYADVGTGTPDWHSISILVEETTFNGFISNISEATEVGYYALSGYAWEQYIPKSTIGDNFIIEVDELPTDNIDDNAIYKVKDWKLSDIYVVNSEGKYQSLYTMFILVSAFAELPRSPNIYNVKTFAEIESIVTDEYNQLDLYYVQDENMVYAYDEGISTPVPNGTETDEGIYMYSLVKDYAYYKHAVGRFNDIIYLENGTVVSAKEQNTAPFADLNYVDVTFTVITDSTAEYFVQNQATSNFLQGYINIYYFPNESKIVNYDYANSIWDISEVTLTFITDKSQATEEGVFYGLREAPIWEKYEMPRGILSSSKNGALLNVQNYKHAAISVPEYDGGVVYG